MYWEQLHDLETGSCDPCYNLAFEEYVLRSRTEGSYLLVWQNESTVVVGQNQNVEAEIDGAFVCAHGIRVVRRATGGGAVYQDLGNLNYSLITDLPGDGTAEFEHFIRPVAQALRALGVPAELSGRNDLLAAGRKISGAAQRILGNRILHHGTLLFDSDLDMAAGALCPSPEKLCAKGVRSVRSRIGNIRPLLRADMDLPAFREYLKAALFGDGRIPDALSGDELAAVRELAAAKYADREWTLGAAPRRGSARRRRWPGGILEPQFEVEDGKIRSAAFYGDFLSRTPLSQLTEALNGCQFRREAVAAVLERFDLTELFGTVTREEILDTLFETVS